MLSILVFAQSLKWVVPATLMLGTAPNYFCLWGCWRILSAVLPKRIYHAGDDFMYSMYQRYILFFFGSLLGTEIVLYGDAEEALKKHENVIFMSNHQSTVDWMVADFLAIRPGSLGYIRYILKDGLKYFPMYGFYFKMHGCVYVKRSGKFQQEKSGKQLQLFVKHNIPFWMVVFPEGTRYNIQNKANIEKSRKFARDKGLEELDQVLTPRHKALALCMRELQSKVDAIYDVTIGYSNTTDKETGHRITSPGLPDFLRGSSPQVHVHIARIDSSAVPKEDEKLQQWLHERYVQKNRLMSDFFSNDPALSGRLGQQSTSTHVGLKHTLPAFLFFTTVNAVMLGTEQGRSLYWKMAATGTVGGFLWMAIRSGS